VSDPLTEQIEELQRRFPQLATKPMADGTHVVTVPDYPLPPGWNRRTATLRFVVPVGYPLANPDSFWTDGDLRTEAGGMPMNTALQQPWPDEPPFLWFSWHPSAWNPQKDSLLGYLGMITLRFTHRQ
jgi:hypothetical protein